MTLYDLTTSILIQGNVAIKVFDEAGNELVQRFYHDQSDLDCNCNDCFDIEECEVTYIYTSKACDGSAWLVIEVEENPEDGLDFS